MTSPHGVIATTVADAIWPTYVANGPSLDERRSIANRVLRILARPANHEALVRWAGDTIGLDTLMRALVDAYGPASIVASMVEVGALEHAKDPDGYGWGDLKIRDETDA